MTAIVLFLGLKSLLIAAITLGILRLTRSRSAAERSTIAHLGLFALVALPLASLLLPTLPITLPQLAAAPVIDPIILPAEPLPATVITETPAAPVAQELAAPLSQSPSLAEWAAPLARYAYALPAVALLVLTLVALAKLVALRSRAEVMIDPHWLNALGRAQHRMGFKSGTALLTSSELRSPISWGLLRPTIVVNDDALVASDQAEAIIAHELAHVIQLDWAKLMLARIATAVFWFNPLAWVLAREAHQLREEAADDAVLAADIAGTDYAQLLVGIARHENHRLLLGAHGVAPGKNSLRRRVARVLDNAPARGPSGRSWVAGFTAGMMVMAAPLAAVTFGPARAADDEADAAPVQATAAPARSWSTKAGEGPNRISTTTRTSVETHHDTALADAVHALPEPAPLSPGNFVSDDGAWMAAGTPEFAAAMEKFGQAMGERYTQAFAARPARPAPAARPVPPADDFSFNFDIDVPDFQAKFAKAGPASADAALGITDAYRKDIANAGFANPSRGELTQAKAVGLTGDYIRAMRAAGINGTLREYAGAKTIGMDPGYIRSMSAAGVNATIREYSGMRNVGVTASYVRSLREAGLSGSPRDYMAARTVGLTLDYVNALCSLGVEGSLAEYRQMYLLGINSSYVRALHDNGNHITRASRLIELKTHGYRKGEDA